MRTTTSGFDDRVADVIDLNEPVPTLPVEIDRERVRVLLVEDDDSLRRTCATVLEEEGYDVAVARRGDTAAELFRRGGFDIALVDLYMEPVGGMELLEVAKRCTPSPIVIFMTGNPSVESSIEGFRAGAWDYLSKPFSARHLHVVIGRAAHAVTVARTSGNGTGGTTTELSSGVKAPIIGRSPVFCNALDLARKVAATDASAFLSGESGTGKELIAHYIHDHSHRSRGPLVPVNAAAIPESLLESEMFGHVRGSFTGAASDKEGLLEAANGGTLFLDEITEMPLPTQAKLLRVVQDGVVRRVGSTRTDAVVDVRFIAASNVDPMAAVEDGRLRRDLYFRLRVVPIHLPPLRARPEDVATLARHFLGEFWRRHRGHLERPELSEEAIDRLRGWEWRGNVRELRNVIEHLSVLAEPGSTVPPEGIPFIGEDDERVVPPRFGFEIPGCGLDYHTAREHVLGDFEKRYLEAVVVAAEGNVSDAARLADVDRTTLYRHMDKHGLRKHDLLEGTGE